METLQIEKSAAIKAFNHADAATKKLLTNLFGEKTFSGKITDCVKKFEDACSVLGIDAENAIQKISVADALQADLASINAYAKLIIVARALNEGWVPDWSNSDEYKYYPWFDLSSGSGLAYGGYVRWHSASFVGSRLCFKSRELAEYAGRQFVELYKEFFIIK